MKTLAIYFGKKYALSLVRDAVSAKKDEVATWATKIGTWIERIGKVAAFLASIADRLSDGEITDEEATSTVADAKALAAEVTKEA